MSYAKEEAKIIGIGDRVIAVIGDYWKEGKVTAKAGRLVKIGGFFTGDWFDLSDVTKIDN